MDESLRESVWSQFGASIDTLENAIRMCPVELWDNEQQFWYVAYHSLFWLDYYLSMKPKEFSPPPPFTLSEFDPSGLLPDRTYEKEELLAYLDHCREKCRTLISGLTCESAQNRWISNSKNYSLLEILLYNMRHVQHHSAQLNSVLRRAIDKSPKWVSVSGTPLD